MMLTLPDLLKRMPIVRPPGRHHAVNVTIHEPAVRDALEDTQPQFLDVILPAVVKQNTVCAVTLASANNTYGLQLDKTQRSITFKAFQPLGSPYTRVTAHLMPPAFCRMFLHSTLAEEGGAEAVRQTFAAIRDQTLARDLLNMLDDELRAQVFEPPTLEAVLDGTVTTLAPLVELTPAWLDGAQTWLLEHALQADQETSNQRRRLHHFLSHDSRWAQRRRSLLQSIERRLMGDGGNDHDDHEVQDAPLAGTRRRREQEDADARAGVRAVVPRPNDPPIVISDGDDSSDSDEESMSGDDDSSDSDEESSDDEQEQVVMERRLEWQAVRDMSLPAQTTELASRYYNRLVVAAILEAGSGRWDRALQDFWQTSGGRILDDDDSKAMIQALSLALELAPSTAIRSRYITFLNRSIKCESPYSNELYSHLLTAVCASLPWQDLKPLFVHYFNSEHILSQDCCMDVDVMARQFELHYLQDANLERRLRINILFGYPYFRMRWCSQALQNYMAPNLHCELSLSELTYDQVKNRMEATSDTDNTAMHKWARLSHERRMIHDARNEALPAANRPGDNVFTWESCAEAREDNIDNLRDAMYGRLTALAADHPNDDAYLKRFIMACMDCFALPPPQATQRSVAATRERFKRLFDVSRLPEDHFVAWSMLYIQSAISLINFCASGPRASMLLKYLLDSENRNGRQSMGDMTRDYVASLRSVLTNWPSLCIHAADWNSSVQTRMETSVREWNIRDDKVYFQFWRPMRRATFIHMPAPWIGGAFRDVARNISLPLNCPLKVMAIKVYQVISMRDQANRDQEQRNREQRRRPIGSSNEELLLLFEFNAGPNNPPDFTMQRPLPREHMRIPMWARPGGVCMLPYCTTHLTG